MASKTTGYQAAVLVSDEQEFDPQQGHLSVQTWEGNKAAIVTKQGFLESNAWKISRRKRTGAVYQIVAQKPLDDPVDRWKIVTEMVQVDIRLNPKVIAAAVSADTLSLWWKSIQAALDAGQSLSDYYTSIGLSPTVADEEQQLYNLAAMGVTSYEQHRPVLTRVRVIPPDFQTPFIIDASSSIYTTNGLILNFSPPQTIISRLPPDPPPSKTPLDARWGWKLRQQESDFLLGMNRVEETQSFVFAAWSTLMYDVIDQALPPGFVVP